MLFPVGQIIFSKGVLQYTSIDPAFYKFIMSCLQQHCKGKYGEVDDIDKFYNNQSAKFGGDIILSSYTYKPANTAVWILTEADRSYTTILLPEEY